MSTGSGHALIAQLHDSYADGYIVGYGGEAECRLSGAVRPLRTFFSGS
jgi:hypothetical protein